MRGLWRDFAGTKIVAQPKYDTMLVLDSIRLLVSLAGSCSSIKQTAAKVIL